ncbi:MAG: hypothetical protein HRT44_04130, partial [Bdellovibrionales bacterium]|nr:hypothetical protein [Bdellovibrionales bacterium]NQZ18431.1 hypothetical protein [Bdellovibrionales bacterium]
MGIEIANKNQEIGLMRARESEFFAKMESGDESVEDLRLKLDEISELESNIWTMRNKRDQAQAQVERTQEEIRGIESQNNNLQTDIVRLSTTRGRLTTELIGLEESRQTMITQRDQLEERINIAQQGNPQESQMKAEKQRIRGEINREEESLRNLESQLQEATSTRDEAQREYNGIDGVIEGIREKIQSNRRERVEVLRRIDKGSLPEEFQGLRWPEVVRALDANPNDLSDDQQQMKALLGQLLSDETNFISTNIKRDFRRLQQRRGELISERKATRERKQALEAEIPLLVSAVEAKEIQIQQTKSRIAIFEGTIESIDLSLLSLDRPEDRIPGYRSERDTVVRNLRRNREDIGRKNQEILTNLSQLEQAQGERIGFVASLSALRASLPSLSRIAFEKANAVTEAENLIDQESSIQSSLSTTESQLIDDRRAYERAVRDLETLRDQYEGFNSNFTDLMEEFEGQSSSLGNVSDDQEEAIQKIADFRVEKESLLDLNQQAVQKTPRLQELVGTLLPGVTSEIEDLVEERDERREEFGAKNGLLSEKKVARALLVADRQSNILLKGQTEEIQGQRRIDLSNLVLQISTTTAKRDSESDDKRRLEDDLGIQESALALVDIPEIMGRLAAVTEQIVEFSQTNIHPLAGQAISLDNEVNIASANKTRYEKLAQVLGEQESIYADNLLSKEGLETELTELTDA